MKEKSQAKARPSAVMFIADGLIVLAPVGLTGESVYCCRWSAEWVVLTVIHTLIQTPSQSATEWEFLFALKETRPSCSTSPWRSAETCHSDVAQYPNPYRIITSGTRPDRSVSQPLTWLLATWSPCEWEERRINTILMYQSAPCYQAAAQEAAVQPL